MIALFVSDEQISPPSIVYEQHSSNLHSVHGYSVCMGTLCAWVFFLTLLAYEFSYVKLRKFTIAKRGLIAKFAHVTLKCVRGF